MIVTCTQLKLQEQLDEFAEGLKIKEVLTPVSDEENPVVSDLFTSMMLPQ